MKKLISVIVGAIFALQIGALSVFATNDYSQVAVYSRSSITFEESGKVKGDAIVLSGVLSSVENPWTTGTIYKASGVSYQPASTPSVNDGLIANYDGSILSFTAKAPTFNPGLEYFNDKDTIYKDGTLSLTIGWGDGTQASGYTIGADSHFRTLEVSSNCTLNITTPDNGIRVIRAGRLLNKGNICVLGSGKLVLIVDEELSEGGGGTIQAKDGNFGDPAKVTLIFGHIDNLTIDNYKIAANIIAPYSNVTLNNFTIKGNIYTNRDFSMTNSGNITGLIYAPFSNTVINNSTYALGMLYTNTLLIKGSAYVEKGPFNNLPADIIALIGSINDPLLGQTPGQTTAAPTTATPTDPASTTAPVTTQPGQTTNPGGDSGTVTIKVTVARRMSIRLENGTVLKNGDTFTMPKYGTIRFQMCTNNWDTDTYTDDGQGIAGTKVFEFTHQKNKELYLRVDNDRHFKFARFHFVKGDYMKLTGVDQVLSVPLESLSINFPLGATITAKAYINGKVVATQDIFVSSDTDHIEWNY